MWRLFWQFRHFCNDMWQTKQRHHPHGNLTELIIGSENGQLAVERGACVLGERKWDTLAKKGKENQLCKETRGEMEGACKVIKLKGHWDCGAMKLNRMRVTGFLWVTQENIYRRSNSCMWPGTSGLEVQNDWEMVGLFLTNHWRHQNHLHLQLAMIFFLWISADLGCSLWKWTVLNLNK